jgi:hypothetical protein
MATDAPPTGSPVGQVDPSASRPRGIPGIAAWSAISNHVREHVPELQGRRRFETYERILTDDEVDSHVTGTFLPMAEHEIWLDVNGADQGAAEEVAADLGVPLGDRDGPVADAPEPWRREDAFDLRAHIAEAGTAALMGVYWFETEWETIGGRYRLAGVYPRHPSTIIETDYDATSGRLNFIRQQGTRRGPSFFLPPPIPAVSLLPYVWRPNAKRLFEGRAILRPLYRSWLCKDVLIRVDVTNHERAGGVPVARTDQTYQGVSLSDLQRLAAEFRVDEEGAAAMPPGAWLELISAGNSDVVASIRYHDGQIAKVWHQMVRELGQSAHGSRALGASFGDLESMARRAILSWLLGTLTRTLIWRQWGWNHGETDTAPILRSRAPEIEGSDPEEDTTGPPPLAAAARPSPRRAGGDAQAEIESSSVSVVRSHRDRNEGQAPRPVAAALPDRPLRRQPYPHEIAAAVDFAALDVAYEEAAERLHRMFLEDWLPSQTDALTAQILAADSEASLAAIRAPVVGVEALTEELTQIAREGVSGAAGELEAQGASRVELDDVTLRALVADHAQAVARQVADGVTLAASRRAVQLFGVRRADEVAVGVRGYLGGLAHDWEKSILRGAVQQATTASRAEVFAQVEERVTIYASELLDAATCSACAGIDGTEYATLADALRDYAGGGYVGCSAGPRCRGTLIATHNEG